MLSSPQPPLGAPRVLGLLVGAVHDRRSGAWIKYGQLFDELAARCERLELLDVDLKGPARYWSALTSVRPSRAAWREAFRKSIWAYGQRSRRARREIARRAGQLDVVLQHGALLHAHSPGGPPVVIYTDFTYRLARREDAWRNPFATRAAAERWDRLEHAAYHGAACILTRSEYARRSLLDDYGVPPGRVAVVGGGVNFPRLPEPAPLAAPRVLFIGRDFERKGGDLLLAAFLRARERIPAAELWMVTDRPDVAAPGVRRIAPTYDRAAIGALYRESSVFAMPSVCETWGDVFLEAMAHGLPCVAADADAMPEIVLHGETGFLAPPGDVEALAAALTTLLANPDLRRRLGAGGRRRVESTFTWGQVAERILGHLTPHARPLTTPG
jgi:glycosyltransferase involved in cell wall biosynthesis